MTPRWLQRKREDRKLARWATELRWQWCDTADGAGLTHHTRTAGGMFHVAVPPVQSVELGPPVTLLVQMLPGQLVEDFQQQARRIAEGMGVPMAHIRPYGPGLIKVILLDHLTTRGRSIDNPGAIHRLLHLIRPHGCARWMKRSRHRIDSRPCGAFAPTKGAPGATTANRGTPR